MELVRWSRNFLCWSCTAWPQKVQNIWKLSTTSTNDSFNQWQHSLMTPIHQWPTFERFIHQCPIWMSHSTNEPIHQWLHSINDPPFSQWPKFTKDSFTQWAYSANDPHSPMILLNQWPHPPTTPLPMVNCGAGVSTV